MNVFVKFFDHCKENHDEQNSQNRIWSLCKEGLPWELLEEIKAKYPRYIRDHLLLIKSEVTEKNKISTGIALNFCIQNRLYSATDFKDVLTKEKSDTAPWVITSPSLQLMGECKVNICDLTPELSDINIYETLLN